MNRNWLVIGVMGLALIAMVGVALHRGRGGADVRGSMIGTVRGKAAPDFELQDVATGKTVRLSDYRGKAVLLNFWATWCPPCKVEIPWFVDLQKQYAKDGLVILGVAMDDAGKDEIAKFASNMSMNYPVLLGTESVGDAYGGVESLPTSFYIGRDGRIVERTFGLRSHGEVEDEIKAALKTQPAATQTAASEVSGSANAGK